MRQNSEKASPINHVDRKSTLRWHFAASIVSGAIGGGVGLLAAFITVNTIAIFAALGFFRVLLSTPIGWSATMGVSWIISGGAAGLIGAVAGGTLRWIILGTGNHRTVKWMVGFVLLGVTVWSMVLMTDFYLFGGQRFSRIQMIGIWVTSGALIGMAAQVLAAWCTDTP